MPQGELPKAIVVKRSGNSVSIDIDGEPFPYATLIGSVSTVVTKDEAPHLTLSIPAEKVEIIDRMAAA